VGTPLKAHDVHVSGNYAYVATHADEYDFQGLQVYYISDPANPTIVGSAGPVEIGVGIYVSDNHAYVADYYYGLKVIDVSDPANPTIVSSVSMSSETGDVFVSGNYAYVVLEKFGLMVIDVSDPQNPTIVGSANTGGGEGGVFVSGNHAYVVGVSGLRVIDISDPKNPTIVGSVDTPYWDYGVFVSGNHAYVADYVSGLQVIDVSDPKNPIIVGSANTRSEAYGVFVSGNHAYVADGRSGLQVLWAFEPCTNTTFVNSTTLTTTVPPVLPVGTYNLHVVNPNGETAILRNSFTTSPSVDVKNLVYATVPPCRIVDTRLVAIPIWPGGIRHYNVYGDGASHGGNPAGCPSPKGEPIAVNVNVTAVPTWSNGNLVAYPYGSAAPKASLVNYKAGVQNIANSGTVKTCFCCAKDISVKSRVGYTHVVIDVLGYYFAKP
jgi:hypothetical protein